MKIIPCKNIFKKEWEEECYICKYYKNDKYCNGSPLYYLRKLKSILEKKRINRFETKQNNK